MSSEEARACVKGEEMPDLIYDHKNRPEEFIKKEDINDENYPYSEVCKSHFHNNCEVRGAALFVPDAPAPPGVADRAGQTLPPGLEIEKSTICDAGLGVFNKGEMVPVGVHFGPCQVEPVDGEDDTDGGYSWTYPSPRRRGCAATRLTLSRTSGAGDHQHGIMTPELFDSIRDRILATLPNIPVESLSRIVEKLIEQGVETEQDLQYVREEDVEEFMKPIQCRKLVDAWKRKDPVAAKQRRIPAARSFSESSGLCFFPSPVPATANWAETFQINWEKMPPGLLAAVRNGKRPSPADRRQMIRVVVDDLRKIEENPSRAQCVAVARTIAQRYPRSFLDTTNDGTTTVGTGYESLLCQIKTRVENLNRNLAVGRRRRSKAASRFGTQRGPADAYGCMLWQPDFPPGETEYSLHMKRRTLTELYTRDGSTGAESADALKLMEATYSLQRRMINAVPPPALADLKRQWPYLFSQRSMCAHFQLLTNVSIVRKTEAFFSDYGRKVVEFFKRKPTNDDVKAAAYETGCGDGALNVLRVLTAHFEEPWEALILQADACATKDMVRLTVRLPETPRLILLGLTSETSQRWMVSIENQVLCEGTSFVLGLAVLFSSYYNFNLKYQADAASTLEFIQRACVGINPERGTKASRDKVWSKKGGKTVQKKTTSFNPRVCSLIKKLCDFEWDFF